MPLAKKIDILIFRLLEEGFMEQLLQNLNPVQREAVTTTEGPLLVIAGAGSGKTRVLTSRVAYILSQRLAAPANIMAVTFTNKAANEMKERINSLLGAQLYDLTVSTFHSFCARLLRREAPEIGYQQNFTIFDEDDAQALIKNCLDELNISRNQFPPASMRRKISAAKNKMIDSDTFAKKASGYFESRTAQVYTLYEERLRQCGAFDFDDLIYRSVQLLSGREDIRKRYQERFKYVLVDEYQDTNHTQYQLLRLLIGGHHNICVVGDEDQSIYGWRGADISNILNFEKDFPGAKVIKMEQNYRSTEIILQAASTVIANNVSRKGKTLWTEVKSGDPLKLFLTDSAADESAAIVSDLESNLERCPLKETVILYRTNAQSRPFEEALRRRNIPYQIIGGVSFYQRKEIKDLMAYLKLIANTNDDISFQRIVNYPRRGIGGTSIEKLAQFARTAGKSLYDASKMAGQCAELGARPQKILYQFVELIETFRKLKEDLDIAGLTQQLVDALRLLEQLISEDPLVGQGRVENIEEFISGANEFTNTFPEPNLDNFLAEISLYTDLDKYKEIEDKLTLMTLHTAKGLEYDSVYLVGLEEGLFPLARAMENPMELEEERRLFYVGATRARKYLQLAMATVRNRFGEMESIPSRFIKELPPALVETIDQRSHHRREYESLRPVGSILGRDRTESTGIHYEYEPEEAMREGRIVQHKTFGRGKVVRVEGSGESLRLEIYFTGVGLKKIMAKYAQLKIVG
ncbi:MAG: ATP-dependent DNA helicase PcrA [candidate division Zixibacteria bacterium HGW-Zixibacteria-1]|nr:MAG: ATP-dependent DNA helicase PcrA [candidate division Zixibacteria bacterium HGW-Zixibacteria-1]